MLAAQLLSSSAVTAMGRVTDQHKSTGSARLAADHDGSYLQVPTNGRSIEGTTAEEDVQKTRKPEAARSEGASQRRTCRKAVLRRGLAGMTLSEAETIDFRQVRIRLFIAFF